MRQYGKSGSPPGTFIFKRVEMKLNRNEACSGSDGANRSAAIHKKRKFKDSRGKEVDHDDDEEDINLELTPNQIMRIKRKAVEVGLFTLNY